MNPSPKAIEWAQRAIRRGAPLGKPIPPCLCFKEGGRRKVECQEDGCCWEAKMIFAEALDAFREK